MKKIFLAIAAVAALMSCTQIEDPSGEFDFAQYLGQDKTTVKNHFGACQDLMGIFSYEYASGEVSMLNFMCNSEDAVAMITAVMRESEKPCADIKSYFEGKYKTTTYEGETVYSDNSDITKASFYISVGEVSDGTYYVYYMATNNDSEEETSALGMDAIELINTFMGMDSDEFDTYAEYFTVYQGIYMADVDDDIVSSVMLTISDDKVDSVTMMAEESSDEEINAIFKDLKEYTSVENETGYLYSVKDGDNEYYVLVYDGMIRASYSVPTVNYDDED